MPGNALVSYTGASLTFGTGTGFATAVAGVMNTAATSSRYSVEFWQASNRFTETQCASSSISSSPRPLSIEKTPSWNYASGFSNSVATLGARFTEVQALLAFGGSGCEATLHALFSPYETAASAPGFPLPDDQLREAEAELFVGSAQLPATIREAVCQNFSDLVATLRDKNATLVMELDSLRKALRFLGSVSQKLPPYFGLKDSGNFYLQWFNGTDSVVGVTFHATGLAIWSSSQPDRSRPTKRSIEAGERSAETLSPVLSGVAPWAFNVTSDATARRTAA